MTFFTILFITTLSGPMDGAQSYVLYGSMDACQNATATVGATLGYDHGPECVESATAARSIKPKRNPIYGATE